MCFLSSLTLFIDTFYVVWPICLYLYFFYGVLNVGSYFFFLFVCLFSYSCELAHGFSTCVNVHHCAWLALLEKGFQHIKMICNAERSYIQHFLLLWLYETATTLRFCSHGGVNGAMVITAVITESQPRLVSPHSLNGSTSSYHSWWLLSKHIQHIWTHALR